jgi:hypothetical protein
MDEFEAGLPPADSWADMPPGEAAAWAELLMTAMALEASRLASLGERLPEPAGADPRIDAVLREVYERASEFIDGGGTLAELQDRLDKLKRCSFKWAKPLPPGPDDYEAMLADENIDIHVPAVHGGEVEEAPADPSWLVRGLFPHPS